MRKEDLDMYAPDDILAPAAREIHRGKLPADVETQLRRDLARADRQNGRVYGGLLPAYDLLSTGQWPETAAARDELCRKWQTSSRQLYQWRRDVLFCYAVASKL